MKRKWMIAGLVAFALVVAGWTGAEAQQTPYTRAEYDAFQAAASEQNPQQKIRLLDDFVGKFPESTLMPHVLAQYYRTHSQLQNHGKVIEYADKALGLSEKIDQQSRIEAIYLRTYSFHYAFNERDENATQQASQARQFAREGITLLDALEKPENLTPEQFAEQKKGPLALFHYTAGFASLQLRDYTAAIESLRRALTYNPNDGVTYFRLGLAYLQKEPASYMDGFWSLARAIALQAPGEAQVRAYLRSQILRYQLTACDNLVDQQMNELLALASTAVERPADYYIPSEADLQRAREEAANLVEILESGGDRARRLFLATCGLPFPEVVGKVFEVEANEENGKVVLRLFHGATQEEI
jgi:tetratricopeptide (TPR) repeat protein